MFQIFTLLFIILCHTVAQLVKIDQPKYPWLVKFQISRQQLTNYLGQLRMTINFDDLSSESMVLPIKHYVSGETYEFHIRLKSIGRILAVTLLSSGLCLDQEPVSTLRLDWLELRSNFTGLAYSKQRMNLYPINDACNSQFGIMFFNFDSKTIGACTLDGKIYENGQSFDVECSARCKCTNGNVGCVDMCPPYVVMPSGQDEICIELYKIGHCCPQWACYNSTNGHFGPVTIDDGQNQEQQNMCKRGFGEADFGSTVVLSSDSNTSEYDTNVAVILNGKWAIAFIQNMQINMTSSYLHILRQSAVPFDMNMQISSIVSSESDKSIKNESNFVLMKIEDYFPASLSLQQTNLPFNSDHCRRLVIDVCSKFSIYWSSFNRKNDQYNNFSVFDEASCINNRSNLHQSQILCTSRHQIWPEISSNATTSSSSALFAYENGFQFLIGLKSRDQILMNQSDYSMQLYDSICDHIDWINSHKSEY